MDARTDTPTGFAYKQHTPTPSGKPILILRAKKGGHVYHIVGRKRGKLLVKNPADDLLPVEMTQEQVDAIAEPAWEWDEHLRSIIVECRAQIASRVPAMGCIGVVEALTGLYQITDHINKLRNGEL